VGRNTLPLARKGHPVDAVELTPDFAQIIAKEAKDASLPIRVIQSNILNPALVLPANYYRLGLIAEVISHFRNLDDVQTLLSKVCDAVAAGGLILFSTFITDADFEPDDKIREMGQIQWSYVITPGEMNSLLQGLPLQLISNESVYEYERAHLPPESWPPTGWFEHWSQGRDVVPIQKPPMSLRWLLCRVNK
jgi:SAM-dependent methyltransferase